MSGVEIKVRSDSTQAQRDLKKLENSVGNIEKSVSSVKKAFVGLAVTIGSVFTGNQVIKSINGTTDSLTNLQNRVALLTGRGKELNQTFNEIARISKETTGSLSGTIEVYQRFGVGMKQAMQETKREVKDIFGNVTVFTDAAKVSQKDLFTVISNVNKAVTISGTGAASAEAALIQLGQGLASGQLRGQELNSVLEQTPRLARAIAEGMGVAYKDIRKAAEEGQITSDAVFEALLSQTETLSKEFSQMAITSERAFDILKTQISLVTAEVSKQLGITAAFTSRFIKLADYLEDNREQVITKIVDTVREFVQGFKDAGYVLTGFYEVIKSVIEVGKFFGPYLLEPFKDFIDSANNLRLSALERLSPTLKKISDSVLAFYKKVVATEAGSALEDVFKSKSLVELGDRLRKLAAIIKSYASSWFVAEKATVSAFTKIKSAVKSFLSGPEENPMESLISSYLFPKPEETQESLSLIEKVSKRVKSLYDGIFEKTEENTEPSKSVINQFLDFIVEKFAWAYNEIIGNSWWTDTMEGVYTKAQEFLPKAFSFVQTFINNVTGVFRDGYEKIKQFLDLSPEEQKSTIQIKFEAGKAQLESLLVGVREAVSQAVSTGLSIVKGISATTLGVISVGIVGAITRVLSPQLFKALGNRLGPFFALGIATAFLNYFGKSLRDAEVFSTIGQGIGIAIGSAIQNITAAIPELVKGFYELATNFGKALADSFELNIFSLIPKFFAIIPGGGIINTLIFGSITAAAFSANFRNFVGGLLNNLIPRANGPIRGGRLLLEQVLIGTAAQRARILGVFGATIAAANGLLGGTIGTAAATTLGIVAGGLINAILFGGLTPQTIIAQATAAAISIRNALVGVFISAQVAGIGAFFSNLLVTGQATAAAMVAPFVAAFTAISGWAVATATSVRASFLAITTSAYLTGASIFTSLSTAFAAAQARAAASLAIIRTSLIALRAPLLAAALAVGTLFATGAGASTGEEGKTSIANSIANIGLIALFVIPIISSLTAALRFLAAKTAIGAAVAAKITGAFAAVGAAITTAATAVTTFIGTLFSLPVIIGSILGVIAGFTLNALFFGDDDKTFVENVVSKFKSIKEAIFPSKKDLNSFRKDVVRLARQIESDLSFATQGLSDLEVQITAKLSTADLSQLSAREQRSLKGELVDLERLSAEALAQQKLYGSVDKALQEEIKATLKSIDEKSGESGKARILGTQSAIVQSLEQTATILESKTAKDIIEGLDKEGLIKNPFRTLDPADQQLLKDLEFIENAIKSSENEDLVFSSRDRSLISQAIIRTFNDLFARADLSNKRNEFVETELKRQGQTDTEENRKVLSDAFNKAILEGTRLDRGLFGDEATNLVNALIDFNENQKSVSVVLKRLASGELLSTRESDAALSDDGLFGTTRTGFFGLFGETLIGIRDEALQAALEAGNLADINAAIRERNDLLKRIVDKAAGDASTVAGQNIPGLELFDERNLNLLGTSQLYELETLINNVIRAFGKAAPLTKELAGETISPDKAEREKQLLRAGATPEAITNYNIAREQLGIFIDEINRAASEIPLTFTEVFEEAQNRFSLENLVKGTSGTGALADELAQTLFKDNSGVIENSYNKVLALTQKILEAEERRDALRAKALIGDKEAARLLTEENNIIKGLTAEAQSLADIVNAGNVAISDRVGLIESAASSFTKFDIDINKLLAIDGGTLNTLAAAQARVIQLTLALQQLASAGANGASDQVKAQTLIALKEAEAYVKSLLEGRKSDILYTGGGGGGDSRSAFEKFQEGLSDIGFSLDLTDTLGLSSEIMQKLLGTTKEYAKVQKEINKLAVDDVENRKRLLGKMTEIRDEAFTALSNGTFGTLELALDGLGIDINLDELLKNPSVTIQDIITDSLRLAEIQQQIAGLQVSQVELRRKLAEEQAAIEARLGAEGGYGMEVAEAFQQDFQSAFTSLLSGESDFGEFLEDIVDAFTMKILNAFSEGFTEGLFGENGLLAPLFDSIKNFGKSITTGITNSVQQGMFSGGEGGGLGKLFENIGKFFKSIINFITGLFGGGGIGAAPVTASAGGTIRGGSQRGFQMLSAGGMVNPQIGKDSVPVMLMPGEYVVDSRSTAQMMKDMAKKDQSQQVFNINVQGDVSRQTRAEIVRMMPEITSGVNMTNRERGTRR